MRFSRSVVVVVFVASLSSRVALAQVAPGESACAALRQLQVPGAALSEVTAEWFAAGSPPPQEPPWVPPLAAPLPAYCRLSATLDRRTGADGRSYGIGFALALPAEWNGRFLFQGGGGLNGTVAPPLGRTGQGDAALVRGFAVVTTDTGHRGEVFDASFMVEQQASLDFAYQAVGRVAVLAKRILAQHYGRPAAHAYFMGCSTGGREGMLMAQRHPTYFDGIVVGAPAMRTNFSGIGDEWVATMLNRVAPLDAAGKPDGRRALSDADRKAVIDGVLATCDAADGLRDGIVSDPIGCPFEPGSLRCAGPKADGCLSQPQAETLARAFAGPKDSKGRQVYPGFLFDTGIAATQGIPGLLAGSANPVGPPFTATEMDVDKRAEDAAAQPQMQLTATSSWTNLNTFSSRGGKLLFFHGVSDPWFSALDTVDYYERMARANGGASAVTGWSRLFLVPGMGHCGGGPATLDSFDMLGAVVDWVEKQDPPQVVRATGRSWPGRSRPLCPYPSHAHYKGTGDVEDAASFECRSPDVAADQAPPSRLLASVFQDHAVLQRDRPIALWGRAAAGDTVSVSLDGQQASARVDASGRWSAELPARSAGGPFTLAARASSGAAQTLSDVLVGDVWLCSGQSNMELTVSRSRNGERVAARSADERLRLLTVPHTDRLAPAADLPAGALWRLAAPETVRGFSAACYFAGRELRDTAKVPMGLVVAAWGGSAAEAWTAEAGLRAAGGFDDRLDLLGLSLRDETAANQRMGRMWEDWWRTHAGAGTEPWQPEPARTGEWADVPEPMRNWKTWGVPLLARHDGLVWFRRTVSLTPAQASRAATLSLGAIDEVDQTWVNGRPIRNTFGWGTDRGYAVPRGVLRAGENVIVVNVLSTWDAGGMTGPAGKLALTFDDGAKVALGGGWRYQPVPLEVGRPPRAPWESVAGLTTLYNGMIAPLGPFGVRGAVWYQGETNADAPAGYQAILAGLMSSWRAQLGAELPFVVVQLPGFGPAPTAPVESGWSDVRDAQRQAVAADAHAALAVTIDLGEKDDIHPVNKRDVGARIARAARRVAYGETIAPTGPAVASARLGPGRVVVSFRDVEGRLVTASASEAIGFELCGAAPGSCRFVSGTVEADRVVIPTSGGPPPARVRFCWGGSPVCNLSDGSGLPVGPFELALR